MDYSIKNIRVINHSRINFLNYIKLTTPVLQKLNKKIQSTSDLSKAILMSAYNNIKIGTGIMGLLDKQKYYDFNDIKSNLINVTKNQTKYYLFNFFSKLNVDFEITAETNQSIDLKKLSKQVEELKEKNPNIAVKIDNNKLITIAIHQNKIDFNSIHQFLQNVEPLPEKNKKKSMGKI